MTLSEINAHSQSVQQSRDIHVSGIINNAIQLIGNRVQYMQTPTALLTSLALALYGAITGIEVTSIAGHALGVYWSQEELNKLNELKQDMNELQDRVNDIFSTIASIEQKLTLIDKKRKITLKFSLCMTYFKRYTMNLLKLNSIFFYFCL